MKKDNKILLLGLIGFTMINSLSGCNSKGDLELKKDSFKVEYGSEISMDASKYIKADKKVLKDTKLTIKKLEKEKDKTYLKVGTYKVTAKYKDETETFEVVVKDTVKPEFKDFKNEIKIEKDAIDVDLTKYFKASDKVTKEEVESTVSVKEDKKAKVDLSKVGDYKIKVTATDNNKNTTTKETTIKVQESTEGLTAMIDGTIPKSEKTKKTEEEKAKEEAEQKAQEEQAPQTVQQPVYNQSNQSANNYVTPSTPSTTPTTPSTPDTLPPTMVIGATTFEYYWTKAEGDARIAQLKTQGYTGFGYGNDYTDKGTPCWNIYYN